MSKFIVKAKEHKVQDGESIKSLADAAGITWQELARFNWGTDEPDEINKFLRKKVGCFKKTQDGHNYIFTSQDDPGIIYIPENIPEQTFSTSNAHPIKVKPPIVKQFKPADCIVKFRPKANWQGEDSKKANWQGEDYGFDWMREKGDFPIDGDLFSDLDFNNVVGKYYSDAAQTILFSNSNGYNDNFKIEPTLLDDLKIKEYKKKSDNITFKNGRIYENFAAYLSVYMKEDDPPKTIQIQAYVTIKEETLDELKFILAPGDSDFLEVTSPTSLYKLAPNDCHKLKIDIKCKKTFSSDKTIKVSAVTRNIDGSDLTKDEVGRLIIVANNKKNRKMLNVLLVKVLIPDLYVPSLPQVVDMTNQENLFTKLLNQALIGVKVEPEITLDLNTLDAAGVTDFNSFIIDIDGEKQILAYKWITDVGFNPILPGFTAIQNYLADKLKKQLEKEGSPLKDKLNDYVKAYYFGVNGCYTDDGVAGGINGYAGDDHVVMFASRNEGTSPHEFIHALGIPHTFDGKAPGNGGVSLNADYTYQGTKTENIMDYAHYREDENPKYKNGRISLYHWQWKKMIASSNLKDES